MKLWEAFEYPAWDQEITDDLIRKNIRYRREELLVQSDWTQLADCPLSDSDKRAWADYRQQLRDLPQVDDVRSIEDWPTPPTG